jgi:hypothetical protein
MELDNNVIKQQRFPIYTRLKRHKKSIKEYSKSEIEMFGGFAIVGGQIKP